MRVDAGYSQTRMPDLILYKVCGHTTSLHMAHPTVPETMHTALRDTDSFADRVEN
jgi:hypothetical protein